MNFYELFYIVYEAIKIDHCNHLYHVYHSICCVWKKQKALDFFTTSNNFPMNHLSNFLFLQSAPGNTHMFKMVLKGNLK